MKTKIITVILFIFLFATFLASAQHHVSGIVTDNVTGERLIGANIVDAGTKNGTSADNNGYFSLITKEKSIQVSFIGYQSATLTFSSDTLFHIGLEAGEMLNEVTVKGAQSKRFNVATLSHKEMLSIPSLGGKPDVLKALQLLPGIQAQQEGSSLLNVRGGNPGENLYLIDNTPLIYVNHLGGFTSVFNPDMINDIEVYKGGFPSKYGGKLSSIVAITQREGDKSGLKGSLSIGVTDASFSIEGPLLEKKASFIITGRKTMIDPLMILISGLSGGGDYYLFYGFHDFNGKFSWHPDEKNSVYFNLYEGDDYLKYWTKKGKISGEQSKLTNIWGNWLASARWNRIISPRLYVDNTFSYTRYRLKTVSSYTSKSTTDTLDYKNEYLSSVQDLSLRSDWQYKMLKNWSVDFGAKATYLRNMPNKINQSTQTKQRDYEVVHSFESDLYFNNKITLFNFIDANIGLRMVNYNSGKFNDLSFEPRILINAQLSETQTLNFSYQTVNQYSHLVFTSGSVLSNEVWIPVDEQIAPSNSVQYSAGWKGSFVEDNFQAEANVYYKELNQLSTYKEGYSNLMGDGGWRSKIEAGGSGIAKGAELLVRKTKGNWTGFVGYTYSNSTRKYPGINGGEEYLFEYDRPHSISITVNRQLSKKWSFNLSWVYQTGLPYTPVIGRQLTPADGEYEEAYIYGERNSARMKDYHRMDIGFTKTIATKRGRKAQWNFSVYNVYNRHNPASYFYGYSKDGFSNYDPENYKPLKQYQISFFPVIPTVSYKVFFEADPVSKTKRNNSFKQKIRKYFNYEK